MKKKYKIKWKNVILAALCLILFLYLIISLLISLFSGSNKDVDIYKIADFSGNKTLQIIYFYCVLFQFMNLVISYKV